MSKNYGFAYFATTHEAQRAIESLNGKYKDKDCAIPLKVDFASYKRDRYPRQDFNNQFSNMNPQYPSLSMAPPMMPMMYPPQQGQFPAGNPMNFIPQMPMVPQMPMNPYGLMTPSPSNLMPAPMPQQMMMNNNPTQNTVDIALMVFVRPLDAHVSEKWLRDKFSSAGDIDSVRINPGGYAVVTYRNADAAARAIATLDSKFKNQAGENITVKYKSRSHLNPNTDYVKNYDNNRQNKFNNYNDNNNNNTQFNPKMNNNRPMNNRPNTGPNRQPAPRNNNNNKQNRFTPY